MKGFLRAGQLRNRNQRPPQRRPCLEVLESRTLLSSGDGPPAGRPLAAVDVADNPPPGVNIEPGTLGPRVIGVTGVFGDSTRDLYRVGGEVGFNTALLSILVRVDGAVDPATIVPGSVLLQAAGGDGVFGNSNSRQERVLDLSDRAVFDPITRNLKIDLAQPSVLTLDDDLYRVILRGTGPAALRSPEGNALDGEDLDPSGAQLPLPSGDGQPGGDFFATFFVDTQAPRIAGSLRLDASADSNRPGDGITSINPPTFTGQVRDRNPFADSPGGLRVELDISTRGDGVFNLLIPAAAVTGADGRFSVSVPVSSPLPDSPYNVGPRVCWGPRTTVDTAWPASRSSTRPVTSPTWTISTPRAAS